MWFSPRPSGSDTSKVLENDFRSSSMRWRRRRRRCSTRARTSPHQIERVLERVGARAHPRRRRGQRPRDRGARRRAVLKAEASRASTWCSPRSRLRDPPVTPTPLGASPRARPPRSRRAGVAAAAVAADVAAVALRRTTDWPCVGTTHTCDLSEKVPPSPTRTCGLCCATPPPPPAAPCGANETKRSCRCGGSTSTGRRAASPRSSARTSSCRALRCRWGSTRGRPRRRRRRAVPRREWRAGRALPRYRREGRAAPTASRWAAEGGTR